MKRLTLLTAILCMALSVSAELKYIFYFIGDGMGANQVLLAEMYKSAMQNAPLGRQQTLMTTFPYSGQAATFSKSNGITDSAAAGTCLATGVKTTNGTLGLDEKGDTLTTIAEQLKAEGWGVGIMTTVAIDHATPAAFYANVSKRNDYYHIGQQLCQSDFDFFGGAGFHYPEGKNDDKAVNLYRMAEEYGYTIAHGYEEAMSAISGDAPRSTQPVGQIDKLILVQSTDDQGPKHGDNLPYAIDRKPGDLTLAQIVETSLLFLNDRYERFFMMVEGGMIDYACHSDDAATAIGETWDMDEAMRLAYQFYLAHPDETLILVTADHETGGLALGNSDYTLALGLLGHQTCSAWELSDLFTKLFENGKKPTWTNVQELYRKHLGLWSKVPVSFAEEKELKNLYQEAMSNRAKDEKTMYKSINALSNAGVHLLNKKAKVGWTSKAHTASAVPVFAIGVGASHFSGWHDNTELVPFIRLAVEQQ